MTPRPIRLVPAAEEELRATLDWYRAESDELWRRFVNEFDAAIERIQTAPETCPPVSAVEVGAAVRNLGLHRFPYRVVFVELPDQLRVIAIAHERRRPGYWRGRLGSRQ